jgi:hypothetical protein
MIGDLLIKLERWFGRVRNNKTITNDGYRIKNVGQEVVALGFIPDERRVG